MTGIGGGFENEWVGSRFADMELPDLTTANSLTGLAENPDVAAGIIAYRDRVLSTPNTAANPTASGGPWYEDAPMNFSPALVNLGLVSQNLAGEAESMPMAFGTTPWDRETLTGIEGLRSAPGFASLGELLALRIDPTLESDSTRWPILNTMSIQQLGYDDKAQGIADGQHTILSQIFGNVAGDTVDGYDEKIAMANAVLNTISVRSDFYAVWFVVHGYQESDVANLRPEDPLVPSVRKRYLMVIDRTNVIEPAISHRS